MTPLFCTLVLIASQSAVPPSAAELEEMLSREPIAAATWAQWSPRLREWSAESFDAAGPAFQQAFEFMRKLPKGPSIKSLPKNMNKDPVAFMVLSGAILNDPAQAQAPVARGKAAGEAARKSIAGDDGLARAHLWNFDAIRLEQLTPVEQGGPAKPDRKRLRDALVSLKKSRALAPAIVRLSAAEIGQFAALAEKWDEAQTFYELACNEQPDNVELARALAKSVNEQKFPLFRRDQPFAAPLKPLVDKFASDGMLACHYAQALAQDRKNSEAALELIRARSLGVDPAKIIDPNLVKQLDDEHARTTADLARKKTEEEQRQRAQYEQRRLVEAPKEFAMFIGWCALGFTVFYLMVMGAMALTGWWLAGKTRGLEAADMLGELEDEHVVGGRVTRSKHESRLTTFYALALALGLILFYLALPFILIGLLLVFVVLLLFLAFTRRTHETADLRSQLMRAGTGSLGALFKALFARTGTGGWGIRKDREECPNLFKALDEVAKRVDIDTPHEVWVAPGAEFYVYQRGRGPFGVFGGKQKVLTVGLCALNFLTISEFKSILAHEFAHFSHEDTFWHRFLFQVSLSLRVATREMARTGGWVTWVNPFYWFFWLYAKCYSMLSAGFSRSREFLADRMACSLYGSDVFALALRKVCTDGAHFGSLIEKNIVRLLKQNQSFINMYVAFRKYREQTLTEEDLKKLHAKFLKDEPSLFASHPTFRDRLEAAKALPKAKRKEDAKALSLFEDADEIEKELTDYLTHAVAAMVGLR